jgi:hypothetical protein
MAIVRTYKSMSQMPLTAALDPSQGHSIPTQISDTDVCLIC